MKTIYNNTVLASQKYVFLEKYGSLGRSLKNVHMSYDFFAKTLIKKGFLAKSSSFLCKLLTKMFFDNQQKNDMGAKSVYDFLTANTVFSVLNLVNVRVKLQNVFIGKRLQKIPSIIELARQRHATFNFLLRLRAQKHLNYFNVIYNELLLMLHESPNSKLLTRLAFLYKKSDIFRSTLKRKARKIRLNNKSDFQENRVVRLYLKRRFFFSESKKNSVIYVSRINRLNRLQFRAKYILGWKTYVNKLLLLSLKIAKKANSAF